MFEISLNDFITAIEKNGVTKGKGKYIRYAEKHHPVAACAFGAAAINLHVGPQILKAEVSRISNVMARRIVDLNDHTEDTMLEIAGILRDEYSPRFLNRKMIFMRKVVYN